MKRLLIVAMLMFSTAVLADKPNNDGITETEKCNQMQMNGYWEDMYINWTYTDSNGIAHTVQIEKQI